MGVRFKSMKIAISAGNILSVSRAKFFFGFASERIDEVSGPIRELGHTEKVPNYFWHSILNNVTSNLKSILNTDDASVNSLSGEHLIMPF